MSGEHTCVKRNKHAVITRVGEEVDIDRMIADKDGRVTPFELSHKIRKKFESDAEYAMFAAALPSEKVMSDHLKSTNGITQAARMWKMFYVSRATCQLVVLPSCNVAYRVAIPMEGALTGGSPISSSG